MRKFVFMDYLFSDGRLVLSVILLDRLEEIKKSYFIRSSFFVPPTGIEPVTRGFSVLCSTD